MTPELQQQILELSIGERWMLLKLLIDSLQAALVTAEGSQPQARMSQGGERLIPQSGESTAVAKEHLLTQYYGCIDDETFIRHPQLEQLERETI